MSKKSILAASALVACVSIFGTAHAEPFSGPYVGASIGLDRDVVGPSIFDGTLLDRKAKQSSFDLGAFAGHNYRIGQHFVISPEAGINFSVDDTLHGTSGTAGVTLDPQRQIDLSVRAGYLVTPKTLVYARGGYSNIRAHSTVADSTQSVTNARSLDGYLVGGGVEYALTPKISTRLEYRYNQYKVDEGNYQRHQALLGVAYHF